MNENKYKVISPAKINWLLKVYPKDDPTQEYHEVNTILQTLSLHDTINFTFDNNIEQSKINCSGEFGEDIANIDIKDNLISKAIEGIYHIKGRTPKNYIIDIEKNIPVRAGLGGGSSNAAAAIIATCKHLNIDVDSQEVQSFAAQLGADVPFFLKGGCVEMAGKGSDFVRAHDSYITPIVLIKPASGISTAECYHQFDFMQTRQSNPPLAESLINKGTNKPYLFNSLQTSARFLSNQISEVIDFLENNLGNESVLLCGSGSSVFGICKDFSEASNLTSLAKLNNWWARATYTSKIGPCLLK